MSDCHIVGNEFEVWTVANFSLNFHSLRHTWNVWMWVVTYMYIWYTSNQDNFAYFIMQSNIYIYLQIVLQTQSLKIHR